MAVIDHYLIRNYLVICCRVAGCLEAAGQRGEDEPCPIEVSAMESPIHLRPDVLLAMAHERLEELREVSRIASELRRFVQPGRPSLVRWLGKSLTLVGARLEQLGRHMEGTEETGFDICPEGSAHV